jgi:hypothetical protein
MSIVGGWSRGDRKCLRDGCHDCGIMAFGVWRDDRRDCHGKSVGEEVPSRSGALRTAAEHT